MPHLLDAAHCLITSIWQILFHSTLVEFHDEIISCATRISFKRRINMSDNFLVDFSIEFAVKIVKMTDKIQGKGVLKNQILKSGTSIGANIHEANYAQSKADFISKLQIALKECYETEYWLKLFSKTHIIDKTVYSELQNDCGKIRRVLISSINTTKEKYNL